MCIGEVKSAIKAIDSSKAVNSSEYRPWISKLYHKDLCVPITSIINDVLQQMRFPSPYKTAEITPVPKHSSPATFKDYRPISLLWHIGKLIELFMNRRIREQMLPHLYPNQYAYRARLGCTDAVVATIDDITSMLDSKVNFGAQVILYDFSKAFDLMQPALLNSKLQRLGVSCNYIRLISDYLRGRSHCVHIKSHEVRSPPLRSSVGVPQGTLCGPTLWLAFVDSLQFNEGETTKYADDTTSYLALNKHNTRIHLNTRSTVEFSAPPTGQLLVDECALWAQENHMILNAAKTKVLNISTKKELNMTTPLLLNGHPVDEVRSTRLLGVYLDKHLQFDDHIASITKAAKRKAHGILVLKQTGVQTSHLIQMYTSQIVPSITHAAAAWYPLTTKFQQAELEKVQRLVLRICLPNIEHYSDRLERAEIPSLNIRLDTICKSYVEKVKQHDHPLHYRLPVKQSSHRHSTRIRDDYITKSRTALRGSSVLANSNYLNIN